MRLFLIRHGQSHANARRDLVVKPAQMNAALNATGKAQAQAMANWMVAKVPNPDILFTSSLNRTRQTAAFLEAGYGIDAIADHRLREGGYCYQDGTPIPDELLPMKKEIDFHLDPYLPYAPEPVGVEAYMDVRRRVADFLEEQLAARAGKTVVVVMHGWVLNAFVDVIMNIPPHRRCFIFSDYTAISYFEFVGAQRFGPWRVHFIAQTPHLEVFAEGLTPGEEI